MIAGGNYDYPVTGEVTAIAGWNRCDHLAGWIFIASHKMCKHIAHRFSIQPSKV